MKILPIDSIIPVTPISPIAPIKRKKQLKTKDKEEIFITDENLGVNVDITINGPLKAPNCLKCAFYYVTCDSNFPHGCKKFEFKRNEDLPSWSVYKATKCHCLFFEENKK